MCGIVGFVSYNENVELIKSLTSSLSHRGPDEENFSIIEVGSQFLHLGSARLSIRGSETGSMPMQDSENNSIIYNGEIFDFSTLKKENNCFDLTSDTRLILKIIGESKDVPLFNGMYAYAFYNEQKQQLTLSRDKFGIKPLYYTQSEKYPLIFSSELKPFQNREFEYNQIDEKEIENYIFFGGFLKSAQPLRKVKKVAPGGYVQYDIEKNIFYNNSFSLNKETHSSRFDNLKDLLVEVVDDHLDADTNVDLLLSGGVDSSLLALIIKNELGKNVRTFSLAFTDEKYDESNRSSYIAKKLRFEHEKIFFDQDNINEIIQEFLLSTSEPVGDPSIIPSYFLYKKVSEHTKAVLSGDGADEIFLGYEWHRAAKIQRQLKRALPLIQGKYMKKPLINLLKDRDSFYKVFKFIENIDKDLLVQILFWQNININQLKQERQYSKFVNFLEIKYEDFEKQLRYLDFEFYLSTNILPKADIGSMLNGLEVRPPYLDNRILSYALESNKELSSKKELRYSKLEMRELLSSYTDKRFSKLPKKGFSPSFQQWDTELALDLLKNYSNDVEVVSHYVNSGSKNKDSYYWKRDLWKFYSIFKWIEVNNIEILPRRN